MKTNLSSKYNFKEVEKGRYDKWLKQKLFEANRLDLKPYTIVIPPPNVTGKLHLGHAWDNTIQDIIIRRKRMQGYNALYLPGMDHAGIATQAVVEEKLRKKGISRYDLGREKFLDVAWNWKEEYSNHIRNQWKALGISVDYTKERFTLDEGLNEAVNHVFIKMYEDGLIYRGNRIINWDVEAKTALSNIEVEHEEKLAKLYYIKYPIVDTNDYLIVATTRPETMFADQAVMIHPEDKRYQKYLNKNVYIPGTNVVIPVIADDYVDKDFGTGVVKVTPAHDANDFEVGVRHNLNMPLCMNEDGTMNELAFEFEGLERFETRNKLIEKLDKLGLIVKIEDYETSIGYSERTGVVVEPRLSLQWFIKMDDLAIDSLETDVNFVPSRFKKIYENWMNNPQDWCISRQLWWGHRIPAWYKDDLVKVQVESPGQGWVQDEDVLDTWFSSALWPFSTLGWPNETKEMELFYPNDVLVTGYDIIFFWVARMIFQGRYFTKQDPFKDVLLHGLIRDKNGVKMSKSLGNGVDPMDVIAEYGVDALRYFLTTNSAPGADLRFDTTKVESSWNFINKLWNISRFVMNLEQKEYSIDYDNLNIYDKWILTRLSEVIFDVDNLYEKYTFNEVAHILYNFIWNEFADWYLELSKISLKDNNQKNNTKAVLFTVLEAILKLLHPFIPFVTEELYIELTGNESIVRASWPTLSYKDETCITDFNIIKDIIVRVRNLKAENKVAPSKPLNINLVSNKDNVITLLNNNKVYLEEFLKAETLVIAKKLETNSEVLSIILNDLIIYIDKSDIIDEEKELQLLIEQKETLEKELARSKKMLSNENFVKKAPKEKVLEEEAKYENYKNQYEKVLSELDGKI